MYVMYRKKKKSYTNIIGGGAEISARHKTPTGAFAYMANGARHL